MASLKDDTVIQLQRISTICKLKVPVVVVWCMTYNHANYIKEALDGFVTQIASFPFIVIVHDDASSDKTSEIVCEYGEKYSDIIYPIIETQNQYSKQDGSLDYIMKAAIKATGAKYIAMCEGDDYWTDPLKLQKQVNVLEKKIEIGGVYSRVQCYFQGHRKFEGYIGKDYISFENLLRENTIPTLTVLIRKELLLKYIEEIKPERQNWEMGDYPMWLWIAYKSKFYFMNEITGVYRILNESVSHSDSVDRHIEFYNSCRDIQHYFIDYSHRFDLLNWVEEYYNSRMYQLCLEQNYIEIKSYRDYFKTIKPTSFKTKMFKISANYRICEYLMKICLQNIFIRKLYNNINK